MRSRHMDGELEAVVGSVGRRATEPNVTAVVLAASRLSTKHSHRDADAAIRWAREDALFLPAADGRKSCRLET